ncbi:MAG: hypothetical protein ISS70_18440 [Phycisphaerae bacterium]|nr:hypothetical protein [Phycisphaerae bacterium]
MNLKCDTVDSSNKHYKIVTVVVARLTIAIAIAILAAIPSVWPNVFSSLKPIRIDTDPEIILPVDESGQQAHARFPEWNNGD